MGVVLLITSRPKADMDRPSVTIAVEGDIWRLSAKTSSWEEALVVDFALSESLPLPPHFPYFRKKSSSQPALPLPQLQSQLPPMTLAYRRKSQPSNKPSPSRMPPSPSSLAARIFKEGARFCRHESTPSGYLRCVLLL